MQRQILFCYEKFVTEKLNIHFKAQVKTVYFLKPNQTVLVEILFYQTNFSDKRNKKATTCEKQQQYSISMTNTCVTEYFQIYTEGIFKVWKINVVESVRHYMVRETIFIL